MEQCHLDGCNKQDGHSPPHRFPLVEPVREHGTCYTSAGLHKRTYQSRKDAKTAIRVMRAKGERGARSVYLGACGSWHIGSSQADDITVTLPPRLIADVTNRKEHDHIATFSEAVRIALTYWLENA